MASELLFQSIPEVLILQVGGLKKQRKYRKPLTHVGAKRFKKTRLQTLMNKFVRLKMKDTETIDDFVGNLSEISSNQLSWE